MKAAFLICAAWSVSVALGCDCGTQSVKDAKKGADVIFRGRITEIRAGKVVFRVDRVWKGNIGPTFNMPDFRETSACLGFLSDYLQVGNDLLVYAARIPPDSKGAEFYTSICTRTKLSASASEDFKKLGRGKAPLSLQ
jgi:hypothetical protein